MSEDKIKLAIINKSNEIAKIIARGKDCEIRKSANGVSIAEVSKKVIVR